jgi:polyhydroxyalkanoate synthesis regulator phasin
MLRNCHRILVGENTRPFLNGHLLIKEGFQSFKKKMMKMIKRTFYSIVLLGLSFIASRAFADDSALIDALVRKGILSQKEAETIQGEVNKEQAQQSSNSLNGVLKIGDWVNELDLYGDLRFRNYYQNTQQQLPAPPMSLLTAREPRRFHIAFSRRFRTISAG